MRSKGIILALVVFGVVALTAGRAVATERDNNNNTDPSVKDAVAIVGIEQLISNYTAYADWGPDDIAPDGELDPTVIGNLFTPNGLWQVGFWNAGKPVVCGTAVGPAGVEKYWGTTVSARTSAAFHHNLQNVQVMLDPGDRTATVRCTQLISIGTPNSTNTSGTAAVTLTGRYYGKVVLTDEGWKFARWFAIEDQPESPSSAYGVPNGLPCPPP
jgi:SnoaL-like domain